MLWIVSANLVPKLTVPKKAMSKITQPNWPANEPYWSEDLRPLTYREIKSALNELSEEQLDEPATVLFASEKEFYGIVDAVTYSNLPEAIQDDSDICQALNTSVPVDLPVFVVR